MTWLCWWKEIQYYLEAVRPLSMQMLFGRGISIRYSLWSNSATKHSLTIWCCSKETSIMRHLLETRRQDAYSLTVWYLELYRDLRPACSKTKMVQMKKMSWSFISIQIMMTQLLRCQLLSNIHLTLIPVLPHRSYSNFGRMWLPLTITLKWGSMIKMWRFKVLARATLAAI